MFESVDEIKAQFQNMLFPGFANILNEANGPQLYYLEVNKMVATIRHKINQRPLAAEFVKNIDEHRQLLAIQSEFEKK